MNHDHSQEAARIRATVRGMAAYAAEHRDSRRQVSRRSRLLSRVRQRFSSDTLVAMAIPVLLLCFLLLGLLPWVSLVALTTKDFLADW